MSVVTDMGSIYTVPEPSTSRLPCLPLVQGIHALQRQCLGRQHREAGTDRALLASWSVVHVL